MKKKKRSFLFLVCMTGVVFFNVLVSVYAAVLPLRHWSYSALDKLCVSGLIAPVEISAKPIERMRAAEIIVDVVQKIQAGEFEQISFSSDLEDIILRLIDHLSFEIAEIAPELVDTDAVEEDLTRLFTITKRVDYGVFNKEQEDYLSLSNYHRKLSSGANLLLKGRADFSFKNFDTDLTVEPVLVRTKTDTEVVLEQAYFTYNYDNLQINSGRFPMWYGPGYRSSLLLSDNCRPFPVIFVRNRKPLSFNGFLKNLGQINANLFIGQMEKDRDFPHCYLTGGRLEFFPKEFLGIGCAHTALFGGKNNRGLSLRNWAEAFLARDAGEMYNVANHLMSYDLQFILPREFLEYFPISNGLKLYGEWGAEDNLPGILRFSQYAHLVGVYLPGVFQFSDTDFRMEFAQTAKTWYVHGYFNSGYTYKAETIGSYVGTGAEDYFFEITQRISEITELKVTFDYQESLLSYQALPEKKSEIIIDLGHQYNKNWLLFYGYSYAEITNSKELTGEDNRRHLFSLGSTYQF